MKTTDIAGCESECGNRLQRADLSSCWTYIRNMSRTPAQPEAQVSYQNRTRYAVMHGTRSY